MQIQWKNLRDVRYKGKYQPILLKFFCPLERNLWVGQNIFDLLHFPDLLRNSVNSSGLVFSLCSSIWFNAACNLICLIWSCTVISHYLTYTLCRQSPRLSQRDASDPTISIHYRVYNLCAAHGTLPKHCART